MSAAVSGEPDVAICLTSGKGQGFGGEPSGSGGGGDLVVGGAARVFSRQASLNGVGEFASFHSGDAGDDDGVLLGA